MPDLPPWHQVPHDLIHPGHHDEATCPTCAPVIATQAYRDGVERVGEVQTNLPLSSSAEVRPGRDGYEQ